VPAPGLAVHFWRREHRGDPLETYGRTEVRARWRKNSDNAAISGADVPQHWGEHRRTCVLQMLACGAEHLTNDAATSNQACREAFSWLSCTAHNVDLVTWGDGVGYVATVIDVFVLGWALVTERGFLWPQELPVHDEQCR
jgi:hypothetical protein